MMKRLIVATMVLVLASVAFADQIDEAEAKKRGVAVEVVQLENARARIAALEKQVKELRAANEKLKLEHTALKAEVAKVTLATPPAPPVAKPGDKIALGMTLDQVKDVIKGTSLQGPFISTETEQYKTYRIDVYEMRFSPRSSSPSLTISSRGSGASARAREENSMVSTRVRSITITMENGKVTQIDR